MSTERTTKIERTIPMRKPPGFSPAVQRWSAGFPDEVTHLQVVACGAQGVDDEALLRSPFAAWLTAALSDAAAPSAHDRLRFIDRAGMVNHALMGYWTDPARFAAWRDAPWNTDWWAVPSRLEESTGYWREELCVPLDRQETIYFADFVGGAGRCPGARLEKTYESGYWGAMRDRIPAAAADPLVSPVDGPLAPVERGTHGARWRVWTPANLAIIRSGQYWENCRGKQREEYFSRVRPRLEDGLRFLAGNPQDSGCCSLRYMQHLDAAGDPREETSVVGVFRSLADLEAWAEDHATHKAIHGEAFRQLKLYKEHRELRTWHEVFVLTAEGQRFEYLNCHPQTGLLPYFEAERVA